MQGLGQVAALDRVDGVQVRQGARDLEQAVGGAQGQAEAFAGAFQPVLVVVAEAAVLTQLLEVEKGIGAALALLLPLAGGGHRGGGLGTAGAAVGIGVQAVASRATCRCRSMRSSKGPESLLR